MAVAGAANAHGPFFSPDGQWIGFFSGRDLKKVSVDGGIPVTLWSHYANAHGASWGTDNTILVGATEGLSRISGNGGTPELLGTPAALWPEMIPDRDIVLYTQGGNIWGHALRSGERRLLMKGNGNVRYALGHIIYPSAGSLMAVPLDSDALQVTGPASTIVQDVMMGLPEEETIAHFAVSANGTLGYLSGPVLSSEDRSLHFVDRYGREENLGLEPRFYSRPRVSPDGTRVAFEYSESGKSGNSEIGVYDIGRKTFSRVTFNEAVEDYPVWAPDGARVGFRTTRNGARHLFWQPADGSNDAEPLSDASLDPREFAFTPDGKSIAYTRSTHGSGADVHLLSMSGGYRSTPLIQEPASQGSPAISPDGRWIAYLSEEAEHRYQIVVRPFPNVLGGRWQITSDGAGGPVWAPSGRDIYYAHGTVAALMRIPVQTEGSFTFGPPQSVFTGNFTFAGDTRNFDVAPDGKRFLMLRDVEPSVDGSTRGRLTIIVNGLPR
jgi:serine/threonine-protein kinase